MSQAKLQAARELIREKQFEAARAILLTISDNPTASEWLRKLPKKKRTSSAIILPIITFGLGVAIGLTPTLRAPSISTAPAPTQAVVAASATQARTTTVVPSPTITNTLTPSNTLAPTPDASLTAAWWSGEQTRAAVGLQAQSTNIALTQRAPTPLPPFNPVVYQGTTAQVLGELELPAGLYKARVTTDGFFIAQLEITSGTCGVGSFLLSPLLFSLFQGQANVGAEAIIRSEGCRTFIETSNINSAWILEITQIN